MLFSSVAFLFYFLPILLVIYYIFKFNTKIKNFILLIFSLIFYAWGEPKIIVVMIVSIILNYLFGILIDKFREKKKIVRVLLVGICGINLSILFVFKYLAFSLEILNQVIGSSISIPRILLPIGISFFTFQSISYVVDIYRNKGRAQKNIFHMALYISFFPQLIAGPIVRYETISDQIDNRKESVNKFSVGCCRFITGLAKKMIIANSMAIVVDNIYFLSEGTGIPMTLAWVGAIAYTLQIFFDFSAYSDMAIGLGLMFGFKFDENFNYPYISKSITEFWRRWHISLGTWFKEYVYFPLGGSRVSNKDKMVRNLFIVWICTGIWHGAALKFIVWALINFIFILIEKITDFENLKISNTIKHIYTLITIIVLWVFFRAENLNIAKEYLISMFTLTNGWHSVYTIMFLKEYGIIFIAAIVFSTPIARKINYHIEKQKAGYGFFNTLYPIVLIIIFTISICYLVVGTYNPFIYFNF